jgi:acyl-CoA thioesterase FadM
MPRVKLVELPDYEFQYQLAVRATDINYAGHLGNEALLGLIHEARARFLTRLGFGHAMIDKTHSVGLIIADLAVNFYAEAFTHEDLTIDCQVGEVGEKSFRLFHRVRNTDQVIALVETGMVAYDYRVGRAVPLPEQFITGLQEYRDSG